MIYVYIMVHILLLKVKLMQQMQIFLITLHLQMVFFYARNVALKNSAPSFNCILKINNQLIEDAQDLDIKMPMLNLLYSSKILEKQQDLFGIIIQIIQIRVILVMMKGHEYFIQ